MNEFFNKYKRLIILLLLFGVGCMIYIAIDNVEHALINSSYQEVDLSVCEKTFLDGGLVQLIIPSEYVYGATQEQLNETANKSGFESVTLAENGTAVYVMTEEIYNRMIRELAEGINQTLVSLPGTENYEDVTSILYENDYTYYQVHLSTNGIGFETTESLAQLRSLTSAYSAFLGKKSCDVKIDYIDVNGTIMYSYDSAAASN